MLQSFIKGKLRVKSDEDEKESLPQEKLRVVTNEDTKTSSVIGEMLHLPADLFWTLLRRATAFHEPLPESAGEIRFFEFWPQWSAEGKDISNTDHVEPDVFIRFCNFDLILEAKKTDNCETQGPIQWSNEICAYLNEYAEEHGKLYLIALGGNMDLHSSSLNEEGRAKGHTVYKCSWMSLLEKVHEQLHMLKQLPCQDSHTAQTIRILDDVESSFNQHGDRIMEWLRDTPKELIKLNKNNLNIIADIWKI